MPGAPDGIANHEPIPQRTVVMGALGSDREHLMPAADKQNRVSAGMADEFAAVGKVGKSNSFDQIWAARLG